MSEKQIDLDAMRALADGARRWDRAGFLEIKKFTDALDDLTTEIEQLRKERDTLRGFIELETEQCPKSHVGGPCGQCTARRAALAAQGDKPHD